MESKIDRLRRILHTKSERYPRLETNGYKPYVKIEYIVSDKDISYSEYFTENFNKLNETKKNIVLDKKKSDIYKIYAISKNDKKYIGSISTTLFYFLRFNLFLFYSGKSSIFDILGVKNPLGVKIQTLEIVKPPQGSRKLVIERKKIRSETNSGIKLNDHKNRDTTVIDAYIALYNSFLCGVVDKKKIRYVYRATQENNSYIFFYSKKKSKKDIEDKIRDKFKFKKNKEIEIELLEKIVIKNSLEEDIMKDRYKIVYQPNSYTDFCLSELKTIKTIKTKEDINYLKSYVFLRVNKLKMLHRYKKHLDKEDFIYSLINVVNGNGTIKHHKLNFKNLIEVLYDKAIKKNNNRLSRDLLIYPEDRFKIKILRIIKQNDNIKSILNRFENRFNLKGYSLNLKQIYSIINLKKKYSK